MRLVRMSLVACLCAALGLPGCSALTHAIRPNAAVDKLVAEGRAEGLPLRNPLALRQDTLGKARSSVGLNAGETDRLRRLIHFLVDVEDVHFRFRTNRTLTAQEAFDLHEGDCMAYANLYVALARGLGVPVHFARITRSPVFYENNGVMYRSSHMAVSFTAALARMVVDFAKDAGDWRTSLYDDVSDEEAFTLYYNNVAMDWLLAGRSLEAEHLLRFLIQRQPRLRELYTNLGTVLGHLGRQSEALAILTEGISRFPGEATLYLNAAQAARNTGDVALAERLLARGGELDHEDAFYLFGRGLHHFEGESYEAAVKDFTQASRSQPKNTVILSWLVRACFLAGQREEGLETYHLLARLAPTSALLPALRRQFPELRPAASNGPAQLPRATGG